MSWLALDETTRREQIRSGCVAYDYPYPVAADWPDLLNIVERLVKPERDRDQREARRVRWWQYAERATGMATAVRGMERAIATARVASHVNFALVPTEAIYNDKVVIFASSSLGLFTSLQSRIHEVWARAFSSTLGDALNYAPTDCFETFPLPAGHADSPVLEAAGVAYHDHRAALMIARDQGMTPTYNRFHTRADDAPDIAELRRLHQGLDDAVLRAYGWDDLADRAAPAFLDAASEDDHQYRGRLFWPAAFRDELLARLLRLNEDRAMAETLAGGRL